MKTLIFARIFFALGLVFLFSFIFPRPTLAGSASYFFETGTVENQEVLVNVYVKTTTPINTIYLVVNYTDGLVLKNISFDRAIFKNVVEKKTGEKGKIIITAFGSAFSGERGNIVEFQFSKISSDAIISVNSSSHIHADDGLGTDILDHENLPSVSLTKIIDENNYPVLIPTKTIDPLESLEEITNSPFILPTILPEDDLNIEPNQNEQEKEIGDSSFDVLVNEKNNINNTEPVSKVNPKYLVLWLFNPMFFFQFFLTLISMVFT